jgi:hypothetical protein
MALPRGDTFAAVKATLLLALVILLALVTMVAAQASNGCITSPDGIQCHISGTTTTVVTTPGSTTPALPLRFLATAALPGDGGLCWFWSPYPPGLDAWDSANDMQILWTIWALPKCPDPKAPQVVLPTSWVEAHAWEIFRSFPLAAPLPSLEPAGHGITGLPSYLSAAVPSPLSHRETLPDGRTLEVEARVVAAAVDWGDGTPALAYDPAGLRPHPFGAAHHAFALKTCPPEYRISHPSGGNCHPTLEVYPVRVTFRWAARYRLGGSWVDLGQVERGALLTYDVDEVVGVLRP